MTSQQTIRLSLPSKGRLETDALDSKEARLHAIHLVAGAYAIGHTLDELDLRRLGVEVTAIRRGNIRGLEPSPETRFRVGDVVVVLGTPTAMAAAETRLLQG